MESLTCSDDFHTDHGSGSAAEESAGTPHFLYIPSSSRCDDPTKQKFDIAIAHALPSPLSIVSDNKSLYTAFGVLHHASQSPTTTSSQIPSPQLTFSGDSVDDDEDMERLIEEVDQASPVPDPVSPTIPPRDLTKQTSKERHKGRHKTQELTKERGAKSQTPTTSRSSSVSGSRSTGRHRPIGSTRPLRLSRTLTSESHFKRPGEERDLVAFHHESRRLFESFDNASAARPKLSNELENTRRSHPIRASTEPSRTIRRSSADSPSMHPLLSPGQSPWTPARSEELSPDLDKRCGWDPITVSEENAPSNEAAPAYKTIQPTVIDWTTPSTRKREYEKIDRSNRGIRGAWHRFAPKWCQSKHQRVPFFDETKGSKHYEGSVRRFRMDIPDDDENDDATAAAAPLVNKCDVTKSDDNAKETGRRRWMSFRRASKA